MTGAIALLAILAVSLSLGTGTRAQNDEPLLQYPDFPPTPTIAPAPEQPAIAGVTDKSAGVLFADSFDGAKAGAWTYADLSDVLPEEAATWVVADGRLVQNGTVIPNTPKIHETAALVGDASWSDYTVSAKVYDEINGTFGLIARSNGQSFYRYRIIADFFEDAPKQVLEKVVNGVATPLAEVSGPGFTQRQWYNVSMSVKGSQIRVWIDGQLVAEATDSELTSGQAGLYTRAIGNIYFDDVSVSAQ
jgi:hypothetical protein